MFARAEATRGGGAPVQLFQPIAQLGSISAFAFNRRRNLIAVAEKCAVPKIFLYSFPELQLLGSISGAPLSLTPSLSRFLDAHCSSLSSAS